MKKIIKYFIGVVILVLVIFGIYLYKLHSLAVEGNDIFEQRCLKVNPPLISYKNSFLKFSDYLKNPDKYSKKEAHDFYDNYISGMRTYVKEENTWLETQKRFINRWDYLLIELWYIKQAGEYQWKMYEGYRDDAQYMLDIVDQKLSLDELKTNNADPRQRRDKYSQLYFKTFDEASKINDWRKRFGSVPIPKGCTEENLTIPNTSGILEQENPTPVIPDIPINQELAS